MINREIYIALVALSVGWSMHARVSSRLCLRCLLRRKSLTIMRSAIFKPRSKWGRKLIAPFIMSCGLAGFILAIADDIFSAFSLYELVQIYQTIKFQWRLHNVKKSKNVS